MPVFSRLTMTPEIFKFLKNNFSQEPIDVDRLLVSSFLEKNDLKLCKNKLLKNYLIKRDDHEEYENLQTFISYFEKYNSGYDFEALIELFEFVISPSDRIVNGAVYTPKNIREFIVDEAFSQYGLIHNDLKICDPACGCSGFLYTAAKKLKSYTHKPYSEIFSKNLYGLDVKNYSIIRSKLLLTLLAFYEGEDVEKFEFNLFEGNTLNFDWNKKNYKFNGFDIIIGNPPYVCSRNIEEESKKYLSEWSVCTSGHPDLYIPFFQIGIENLKPNGVLGYITMNTFFKSLNGRELRKYFKEKGYKFKIIDFGDLQIFKKKSTYTCICLIQKSGADSVRYIKVSNDKDLNNKKLSYNLVLYASLDHNKGWNLQHNILINRIESIGTPFGQKYITRNGIATLKNEIYIFDPIDEDKEYFYLKNGNIYQIEKIICKDIINPNKLTKIPDLKTLKRKAIFPYYFEGKKAKSIPENHFQTKFPLAFKYLCDKRDILEKRDKGNGNYEAWFVYGRNQSLDKIENKLFFPHITSSIPNYVIETDENLLFYNGMAVICDNIKELQVLKKLMESRLFWFYIKNTSKPYGSGFYSLSRNYIKNFGIYDFSDEDQKFILKGDNEEELNQFFESKYRVFLPSI